MEEIFKLATHKITHSPSSLFTKEDVIKIVEELQAVVIEAYNNKNITLNAKSDVYNRFQEEVESRLINKLDNHSVDLVNYESAEFNIEYNNTLSLDRVDVNTDMIADMLNDILLNEFEKHFGALEE